MTPQRITLVTLGVSDMARSRAFYAALGWQMHPQSQDEVTFYQANGFVFGLFGLGPLAADQGRPDATLGTGASALAQNFSTEAEVDAAYALALEAGAKPMKAPEKVFWGGYSGYFADPDGHVWELAMNPFWPLNDDGSLTLPEADDAD